MTTTTIPPWNRRDESAEATAEALARRPRPTADPIDLGEPATTTDGILDVDAVRAWADRDR